MSTDVAAGVSPALQHEIEQFLYAEAELLDDRRYAEWVDLFDDAAAYWSPVRRSVATADPCHIRSAAPRRVASTTRTPTLGPN